MSQLWEAGLSLLQTLEHAFRPGKTRGNRDEASDAERALWRDRYCKAITLLQEAGIDTIRSAEEGADAYVAMRTCWHRRIVDLASYMAWRMDEIDVAISGKSIQRG